MLWDKAFAAQQKSALAELGSAASCFETVLLTFFHTWVTCKVSGFLKHRSVIRICFKKCSCDSVTDCSCLSCVSTTTYVNENVKFINCFSCN